MTVARVAGFTLAALALFGAAPRALGPAPSTWQRITFAPLAIPGTTERMDVRVSQEVIVGTGNDRAYRPIGTAGTLEPSFLRFDLEWSARDDAQCRPVAMPAPIADGKAIRIALHHGANVVPRKQPNGWIGVSNACGTTWFLTEYFSTSAIDAGPVFFEVQAAGRTYWAELPEGLARSPSSLTADETTRGSAKLPAYLTTLTENDVLIPWATVRYALDRGGSLDMIDGCDGLARVTIANGTGSSIEQPAIRAQIRRPDGTVFIGREISRSIGPRQSVFDFKSRSANLVRTWDALDVSIDGASTVVTMPSTLYLLGLRLADWGDQHRVAVPDITCKD